MISILLSTAYGPLQHIEDMAHHLPRRHVAPIVHLILNTKYSPEFAERSQEKRIVCQSAARVVVLQDRLQAYLRA